jgi:hypothetical protein
MAPFARYPVLQLLTWYRLTLSLPNGRGSEGSINYPFAALTTTGWRIDTLIVVEPF